jgi:hypothetical protein
MGRNTSQGSKLYGRNSQGTKAALLHAKRNGMSKRQVQRRERKIRERKMQAEASSSNQVSNLDIAMDVDREVRVDNNDSAELENDALDAEDESLSESPSEDSDADMNELSDAHRPRPKSQTEGLSEIIGELDKWCRDGCPGYRTPYLKAIDRAKVSLQDWWHTR